MHRARRALFPVLILLFMVLAWLAGSVHLGYAALEPGSALPLGPRISVEEVPSYEPKGSVLFATVGIRRHLTPLGYLAARIDPEADVFREKDLFGDSSPQETRREFQEAMDDSKTTASVVAVRRLGLTPEAGGLEIGRTVPGTPGARQLKAGEIIERVDGRSLCLVADFSSALAGKRVGDTVLLIVKPKVGSSRVERITLVHDHESQRAIVGIEIGAAKCRVPFPLKINTGKVGGPSAGLALTLAILDELSPGELTGGVKVAATGTIAADGTIGPVGGVKQKTLAVRRAGAQVFLVPADEVHEARPHAGSMKIESVATLDDALEALQRNGGSPCCPKAPA